MSNTITVRNIDPSDKSWLKFEARQRGVSMAAFVRQLIHEHHEKARSRTKPSEAFKRYFGPENGFDLPTPERYGYRPVTFPGKSQS